MTHTKLQKGLSGALMAMLLVSFLLVAVAFEMRASADVSPQTHCENKLLSKTPYCNEDGYIHYVYVWCYEYCDVVNGCRCLYTWSEDHGSSEPC